MSDNNDKFESTVECEHDGDIDTHGLLLSPSDGTYITWEEAYNLCQDWARTHGYYLRINSSSKLRDKTEVIQKVLVCDLEGEYECKSQMRKHRISKKKGCDFKLTIDRKDGSYHIKIHSPHHKNHEASWSAFKHIIHRRRDEPSRNLIRAQITVDVHPKDILTGLGQPTGSTNITLKDIYNDNRTWRQW